MDYSQNCYRVQDTNKQGIISCLTPSGIPFNTTRGGKVLGLEALIGQGLPIADLDLDQFNETQLRDLAGNAMSSTVVTTCLLAAATVFREGFDMTDREAVVEPQVAPLRTGDEHLQEAVSQLGLHIQKPVSELKDLAKTVIRLCYCECRHGKLSTDLLQCTLCKHTACIKCGRNPKHNYEPLTPALLSARMDPAEAEFVFKQAVPMKLSFTNMFDVDSCIEDFMASYEAEEAEDEVADKNKTIQLLKVALQSEVQYQGYRRREVIEIEYHSQFSKLILRISPFNVQWQLFAKVPEGPNGYAGNHPARLLFDQHPIAQMTPSGDVVTEGEWSFWAQKPSTFPAIITSSGSQIESFHSKIGLETGTRMFSKINLDITCSPDDSRYFPINVRGDYIYRPDCGQAFDSLHVKKGEELSEGPPLSLFFHHDRQTGDPKTHSYTISKTTRRLDFGERREVNGNFDISWRPHTFQHEAEPDHVAGTSFTVDGYWTSVQGFSIVPSANTQMYKHLPSSIPSYQNNTCDSPLAAFLCNIPIENSDVDVPKDKWVELTRANGEAFFQAFGWALERGKRIAGHTSESLERVDEWHLIPAENCLLCKTCSPEHPVMSWTHEVKTKGKPTQKQIPFEDPATATTFEKALKSRPAGFAVFYRVEEGFLHFQLGINPATLAHQALAALQPDLLAQASWFFVTDDTSATARLEPLTPTSTENEQPASQPAGFKEGYVLRPEQLRKLAWMIKQEAGVEFTEREFTEARLQDMGYLLMGQAKQNRKVRGGILADEVGFGKTIVILALLQSCLAADALFAKSYGAELIPSKATVIFVPCHLGKQWRSEAEKFLPEDLQKSVLLIESIENLKKLTIGNFEDALLIIISCKMCQHESYRNAVARLTGMVEPATTASSRALAAWFSMARGKITSTVDFLKHNPGGLQAHLESEYLANEQASRAKVLPVPSKRLTGAKFKEMQDKQANLKRKSAQEPVEEPACKAPTAGAKENPHQLSDLDVGYRAMKFPVLEMFAFARVVIDEFTYVDPIKSPTLMNMVANSYWGLSGTSPCEYFSGVKTMADILHVHLGVDDYSHMRRDVYEKVVKEMTSKTVDYLLQSDRR